jgi:hypothetical protein
VTAAPLAGQLPRVAVRGGVAFPKGDYDQTTEGLDMFAKVGWTAGGELRFGLTENLGVFLSYDRISNPVDEVELEASIGTINRISSDNHVAQMTMIGFRMEDEVVPNTSIALHGGYGLAAFKPGNYAIQDESEVMWESDRHMSVAGGFSVTIYGVEAAFRFYPMGTFSHGGTVESDGDESDAGVVRAPVRVMTLTLGYVFP